MALEKQTELAALFGHGRSGTTWLGAILNTHPDVVYRFEPFTRMVDWDPALQRLATQITSVEGSQELTARFIETLVPSHPMTDKPPFFEKSYRSRFELGRRQVWMLSKVAKPAKLLYRWAFTPLDAPWLLFKEVDRVEILEALAQRTQARIVYLLRHPCAVAHSYRIGIEKKLMPEGRYHAIGDVLRNHAPDLFERFRGEIETMSLEQRAALLWRMDTESALRACAAAGDRTLVVFYENLCMDQRLQAARVFEHLGLEVTEQTQRFLSRSTSPDTRGRDEHGDEYFSVYRAPLESMNKWKKEISPASRHAIEAIVADSSAYQLGVREAGWADS